MSKKGGHCAKRRWPLCQKKVTIVAKDGTYCVKDGIAFKPKEGDIVPKDGGQCQRNVAFMPKERNLYAKGR